MAVDHKAGRGAAHEPTKPTRPDQPPFMPPPPTLARPFDNIQIHLLGQRISLLGQRIALLGPEIHLLGQNPTATRAATITEHWQQQSSPRHSQGF